MSAVTERSLTYRPYLDGVRAIAVLFVFVFHAARPGLPGGFIGVDVFFVLSGYLITRILLMQHSRTGTFSVSAFYVRRMRRLLPAVVLLVLVVVVREAVWGDILASAERLKDALATLFYVENWNLIAQSDEYFAETLGPSPLRHAWSLSIEEQFYLVWPWVLLAILFARRVTPDRSLIVVIGLIGISAVCMFLLFEPGLVSRAYYGTDARVQQPLVGAALAFLTVRSDGSSLTRRGWASLTQRGWVWPAVAAGTLVLLVLSALWLTGDAAAYYRGWSTVVAVLAAVLILALERSPHGWMSAVLGWFPLKQLGRISYGFYLWHWPIILWLAAPAGFTFWERRALNVAQFGLTLAISAASFVLLENPIREGRFRLGRLSSKATLATGTATLVAAGSLSVALLGFGPTEAAPPVLVGGESHPASQTGDPTDLDLRALADHALSDPSYEPCPDDPQPCVKVNAGDDAPVVVLIGDSTAQAYDPALKQLAVEYGFTYVQAAVGGCPISHRLIATGTDGQLHKPSNMTCYEEIPRIYETVLTEYEPDLFIATSWNETNQHVDEGNLIRRGTSEHLAAVEEELGRTIDNLTSGGAKIALIHILPPGKSVECLDAGDGLEGCVRPVTDESGEAPYNQILDAIANDRDDVVAVTLEDVVCPQHSCPLVVEGIVMRYDGGHFTGTASRYLAPILDRRLERAGIDLASMASS